MARFDRHAADHALDAHPTPLMEPLEQRMLLSGADLTGTVTVTGLTLPDSPAAGAEVRLIYERNPDPQPGLESYTIKLVGATPDHIVAGFEGRFDGAMNQVWYYGNSTPSLTNANGLTPDELARDTHVLFFKEELFSVGRYPEEDRDPASGVGTWLSKSATMDMAFALKSPVMANEVALAQVVVPAGEQVVISGEGAFKWYEGGSWAYGQCVIGLTIPATDAAFSVDYTVRNVGDADAGPFWVDFYMSSDTTIDVGDTLLRRVRVNGLAAGATQPGSLNGLDLPDANLDADWYVVMDIDAAGEVADSNTLNNRTAEQILAQTPEMSISDAQVVEGDSGSSDMVFTVSLSAASATTVSVQYATTNDTAAAGDDYLGVGGTLVLGPGQTQATLIVPVFGDTLIESDETFYLDLQGAAGATLTDAHGTGTILDDDIPSHRVDDVTVTEGDAGTVDATFTVRLSGAYYQTVTVDYATVDGSASAGSDYTAQAGSLEFTPGQTTRTVTVTVSGDEDMEVDEAFHLDLSGAANATVADRRGTATIVNDDGLVRGFDAAHRITFTDASGDLVTISMTGPGQGRVVTGAANGFDPDSISLTGTTAQTKVIVATKGAGSSTTVRQVRADGYLGRFTGKTLDLVGDFLCGPVTKLTLRDVTGDHVIDIGARAAWDQKTTSTIVLGRVADVSLLSLTPIKSLTVIDWQGTAGAEQITAPWIGKLSARGNKAAGVAGDFQASLALTAPPGTKPTLAAAKIAGGISGAIWDIVGDMGKLTVLGAVTGSTVRTAGSMAGVTVGASDGSDFLAGLDPSAGRRPDAVGDFDNVLATIKSFKVKGIAGAGAPRWFFADSNVSAATLGVVSLLNVNFDNSLTDFGVWARHAGTGKEIKSVKWADKVEKTKGAWTPKAGIVFALPDLAIEILTA